MININGINPQSFIPARQQETALSGQNSPEKSKITQQPLVVPASQFLKTQDSASLGLAAVQRVRKTSQSEAVQAYEAISDLPELQELSGLVGIDIKV